MDPILTPLLINAGFSVAGGIANLFKKRPPKQETVNITDPVANQNEAQIRQLQNTLLLQQERQRAEDAARGLTGSGAALNQMKIFDTANDEISQLNAAAADRMRQARERQELINSRIRHANKTRDAEFTNNLINQFLNAGAGGLEAYNLFSGFSPDNLSGQQANATTQAFAGSDMLGRFSSPTYQPSMNTGIGVGTQNIFSR